MHSVLLAFPSADPEPEDDAVRAYVAERELVPKWQGKQMWEDREYEVMYFGGCYLGRHLEAIEDVQRSAVQREMLAAEIRGILGDILAAMSPPDLEDLVARLAREFHQDAAFEPGQDGYLAVTVEPAAVRRRFEEMASGRA